MVKQSTVEHMMTSADDVYKRFIPSQKGESLEEQIYPWNPEGIRQKSQKPISMDDADPLTFANILGMRAVERHHWAEYSAFVTMISDPDFKKLLNSMAWAEHMHFLKLHSLLPVPQAPSQAVMAAELALIKSYDRCLENEPNDTIKSAFERIRQDHLQHAEYASQQLQNKNIDINKMTGGMKISGGKSLEQQFIRPEDSIWQGQFDGIYKKGEVDPHTLVNVDMSLAGEMSAWSGYACAAAFERDEEVKLHFGAFASVENQHVSILGSLRDPSETIIEKALVHEQVEMQNYHRLMEEEPNQQVREVFEDLYEEDLEQARLLGEIVR